MGDDITFDGSGSIDPDGDPLTYIWTMPDGSVSRGQKVTWRADKIGEELVVTLEVKDNGGLTDTETETIDILEDESPRRSGEIWPFLITVIPLILILLMLFRPQGLFGFRELNWTFGGFQDEKSTVKPDTPDKEAADVTAGD